MPEQPEQKQETIGEVVAAMRRYAELVAAANADISPELAQLLREYADRIEAAAERDYEEAKSYFEKMHDGPSMICTAKNCSLRNAAEDIVEQVKAEASFGHVAPVVVEDRPVGNAAAMRAALENVERVARFCAEAPRHTPAYPTDAARADVLYSRIAELGRVAHAALSSPARNCDKYGIDDIKKMDADFGAFCQQYGAKDGENCVGCPIKHMDNLCCHSVWMLLPAEGGAK